jgi:hypothetical protein
MSMVTLQGRPVIEKLPSGLRKITRFSKVSPEAAREANIESDVFDAIGTADAEFTSAFLIDQRLERRTEQGVELTLIQVFHELEDNELTATTEIIETTLYDGRRITRTKYLCKASQADTLRPTIAEGVFQVDVEKNGFIAIVVKYEITLTDLGFVYSDNTDTRNNGKLSVRTIRTLGEIADTPEGYTLVTSGQQIQDGYTIHSATFARGSGRVSLDTAYRQKGKLKITTIRYLDEDDGTPITGELVNDDFSEQDGYTLFTKGYAEIVDDGMVLTESQTREGGKLVLYHRVRLGSAPDAPSATIGGTVVLISATTREEDGFTLHDYRWAEGKGQISEETRDALNGRITYTTIRALGTAVPATGEFETREEEGEGYTIFVSRGIVINSTDLPDEVETREGGKLTITTKRKIDSAPTGTGAIIDESATPQEGYTLHTRRFAVGDGEVSRQVEYSRSSDQGTTGITRTTIRHLTATSTSSDPTSLIGSVKIAESKADQDGFRLWTIVYAKGTGLVVDDTSIKVVGRLVTYHRVALGGAPTTPTATISGTVTAVVQNVRKEEGFDVYDYEYVEANGQLTIETISQPDGALDYVVTTVDAAASTPSYPGTGTGYLIRLEQQRREGFFENRAIYRKPPETVTYKRMVSFTMPGLASFSSNQLTLSPPTARTLLADVEVSYDTSQLTDDPFTVSAYAGFYETYTPSATSVPISSQRGLGGYLSSATSVSGTNANYNGVLCDEFSAVLVSSIPSSRPTGATVLAVENDDYLVAIDGTKVFRRTKATFTF